MKDITVGALGEGAIGPIPYTHALRRVTAYISEPGSGWGTYDMPAEHARCNGQFDGVGPWSLLLANALSGRVDQSNIAAFDLSRRTDFAERVAAVPAGLPLANMSDHEVDAVVSLASFGFKGVWGPKTTKLAALYRPAAVPVLDGQMALAFGLPASAFRSGPQWTVKIGLVVRELAAWQKDESNARVVDRLRSDLSDLGVQIHLISDVRLLDIVLWTSQDDRFSKRSSKKQLWLDISPSRPLTLAESATVEIPTSA